MTMQCQFKFVVTAEHPQNGELLEDPDTIGTTAEFFNPHLLSQITI